MKNLRKYGKSPFNVAVVHGGPGAAGEMAPVAKELSKSFGVLEPLQTRLTIVGQIQELKNILNKYASKPVILIGYSWGAMLSMIFVAKNPSFVKKLILISSGPFEDKYAKDIMKTRMKRLSKEERTKIDVLLAQLSNLKGKGKNKIFAQFGRYISIADSYDPFPYNGRDVDCRYNIFENVWKEAKKIRNNGKILNLGKKVKCPVIAIHGDYDPHPVEGVKKPLLKILKDFKFILLKNCGHCPWIERKAGKKLFEILLDQFN